MRLPAYRGFRRFHAALLNAVFGLMLAWVIVRYDFPGRRLMDGLIELPFALPTARTLSIKSVIPMENPNPGMTLTPFLFFIFT